MGCGQSFWSGFTGVPILEKLSAFVECHLVDSIKTGDHLVFVNEAVVDARVSQEPEGRSDEATFWLKELCEKAFYGGSEELKYESCY